MLTVAKENIKNFPALDLGCLYLKSNSEAFKKFAPFILEEAIKHFGSVYGSWPKSIAD